MYDALSGGDLKGISTIIGDKINFTYQNTFVKIVLIWNVKFLTFLRFLNLSTRWSLHVQMYIAAST